MAQLSLWKAYGAAPQISSYDRSAVGTMPAAALQYCEAMRRASALGHHVYPPCDISLLFDGREVQVHFAGEWRPLKSYGLGTDFAEEWAASAPVDFAGHAPPFITDLFVPGAVQIWSGYFAATPAGHVLSVRTPVNADFRSSFRIYEGIVETDIFAPWPVFTNLQLLKTDVEIFLPADRPLFQLQVLPRSMLSNDSQQVEIGSAFGDPAFPWKGLGETVRTANASHGRPVGRYAAASRRGIAR